MTKRVAILISGGGSNMVALARDMAAPDHPAAPCIVVSNVPSAGGLARAEALGIPTAVVDHRPHGQDRASFEAKLADAMAPYDPDLICLAGFMRILTPDFVELFEGKMLNIHPSLLPKYKGLNTHARAIEAGDTFGGVTVHGVTAALDDGPIYGQARVPILPDDTPETLADRVLAVEHRLYPAVLRRVASGVTAPLHLE